MLYAVKFWSQAPEEGWKLENVPSVWPWKQNQIQESERQVHESLGWSCFTAEEYASYISLHQETFNTWWANREAERNSTRLKVYDLVQDEFQNYHPSKIDFTIHLKPNVVLNKKTTMLKNGRPEKAEYFNGEEKICEIKFDFTVNAQNFMTSRTEKLAYVRGDNTLDIYYTIKTKTFDPTNFHDKAEVVEERSDARQYIMKEIKSVLSDTLGLYYIVLPPVGEKKTPQELWQIAGEFWTAYSSDIDAWYNTATEDFKTKIQNDVTFAFLNLVVPQAISQEATDKTVRQYIIDRITY